MSVSTILNQNTGNEEWKRLYINQLTLAGLPTGPYGIGINSSNMVIPFNATGSTGTIGPTGYTGFTGPTGQAGSSANTGSTGPTGPIGLTGSTGSAGSATNTGATGPTGLNGFTGPTGAAGSSASTGATGPTGASVSTQTGVFTPILQFGGSSTGITYNTQQGQYTKISNVVNFCLSIALTSKGSSVGSATISGLPFSCNTTTLINSFSITYFDNTNVTPNALNGYIINGQSTIQITAGGIISSPADNGNFNNNTIISISGFYYTT